MQTLSVAAHANNAVNGRTDNGEDVGILDYRGDQRAIRAGFYYPKAAPGVGPIITKKYPY